MSVRQLVPVVIESSNRGERSWDIFSRLLRERIVFVGAEIDDELANLVIAQLLFLAADDPEKEIQLFITSNGGSVTAGLAIYDVMRYVAPPISTVCVGMAASMATPLLAAGEAGKRFALPNATIHMHPASGGVQGLARDLATTAAWHLDGQRRARSILARHTGQPLERIERDFGREVFLTAQEAREYGIIDAILDSPHALAERNGHGDAIP